MGSALLKVVMDLPDDDREEAARSPYRDEPEDLRATLAPVSASRKPSQIFGRLLSALMKKPEMLEPPKTVIPKVAAAGSVTMLVAREKVGKSTFLAFLAAAVSLGRTLFGELVTKGRVLWLGLEEDPRHAVCRFADLGVDNEQIVFIDRFPSSDPVAQLKREIEKFLPEVVIIDSLSAFFRGVVQHDSTAAWDAALPPLIELARDQRVAIVIIHHATKGTGEYRGSTVIGASMDLLLEMSKSEVEPNVRVIKPSGRLTVKDYAVRYDGSREWTLTDHIEPDSVAAREAKAGELRDRVLGWITAQPTPVFLVAIRKAMGGRAEEVDAAVRSLRDDRLVVHLGARKGYTVAKRGR